MVKKRSSSRAWLKEHREDLYVQRAVKEGYRSRACYKLKEINDRDRVIKPGMTVLDLGAAPGGWSQVAVEMVGTGGRVIASDILPMDSLADVESMRLTVINTDVSSSNCKRICSSSFRLNTNLVICYSTYPTRPLHREVGLKPMLGRYA